MRVPLFVFPLIYYFGNDFLIVIVVVKNLKFLTEYSGRKISLVSRKVRKPKFNTPEKEALPYYAGIAF